MIVLWALIFIAILFIYMIKPGRKRFKGFPVTHFAHRGLHGGNIPENSIAAFKNAKEKGFGVELDVRFTRDKKLVVFHDDNLKRLCDVDQKVNELTCDELKKYTLSGTKETIPLFSEALGELDKTPIICEIKSIPDGMEEELCEAVCREIESYKGFVCVESFNPFVLRWFKKNRPDIIRGQLSMNFIKNREKLGPMQAFLMTHLLVNLVSRPDFIAYRATDDSFGWFLCRYIFKPINIAWTVITEKEKAIAKTKYEYVIFEER
ncbi:MAG: glycerophosphodiester phosphodiesterase [Clostridiaceae bacterium]|nr:glycerophosphodiester phosphodiesterase [Clostridiaceae bacterium]